MGSLYVDTRAYFKTKKPDVNNALGIGLKHQLLSVGSEATVLNRLKCLAVFEMSSVVKV